MELSKYNIFTKIRDSENYLLLNILSGNADILDPDTAKNFINKNYDINEMTEKGYLVNPEDENKLFNSKYLDFIDNRDNEEIQIFFVPQYLCNFNCSYCYQDEYTNQNSTLTKEIINSFFNYIKSEFAGRKKYITLFGGEPLLSGNSNKEIIKYFIQKTIEHNLDLAVVTNGYTLTEYLDILKNARLREIQITLDGTQEIHNSRRMLKGGKGTFNKIIEGIDATLKMGISVNLRVVLDKDNIENLTELSDFAIDKGWTKNILFKTQLGRNYELHHCQKGTSVLFSRIEMYESLYKLIRKHPQIIEFHKPAFSIASFLYENGELPDPLFDACTGTTTEWAFDYTGNIYSCTATVGKSGEELGTFYPEITKKQNLIDEWEERDITSIKECKNCSVQLICGGGCASVAKNENGTIFSTDCRPVENLLELGSSIYFENNNKGITKCLEK